MKTQKSSIENKIKKIDKNIKKTNTIQSKQSLPNSHKPKSNYISNINKGNSNIFVTKKDENSNNILNSLNNNSIQNNKLLNTKKNKLPINKKLNIIKEANENKNTIQKNINNNNKKIVQRNNKKQFIADKNKSYFGEEKKKSNIVIMPKKEEGQLLIKKFSLQDNIKLKEKLSSNLKFSSNKSSNIDNIIIDKNKKEKDISKNNPVITSHKNFNLNNKINHDINKKSKLKKIPNIKKNTNSNQDDIFIYDESKPITLTQEEIAIYGDRHMKGYNKIKILGKGGYGVVWLGKKINVDQNDDIDYAIKQTSKVNAPGRVSEDILQVAKNEIDILLKLNENEDEEKNKSNLIPKIYETYEDHNDIWFSFEKGGLSLSALTFNIKGIFEKGERLYHIQKGEFLVLLFKNIKQFKFLISKILEGIDYINKKGIIHSDIKPENILVQYTKNNDILEITSVKIIDYGSAFYTSNQSPLISNTPEYLCPEIMTNKKEFIKELNNGNYLNAIDIWSTGISILELCLCCPIWMSYKTKIYINGKINNNMGYFGCKCRDGNKIYQKQIELSQNLNKILKNSMIYMFDNKNKSEFIDLLCKMLTFDYTKRITIEEALKHPFLNEYKNEEIIENNIENNGEGK